METLQTQVWLLGQQKANLGAWWHPARAERGRERTELPLDPADTLPVLGRLKEAAVQQHHSLCKWLLCTSCRPAAFPAPA